MLFSFLGIGIIDIGDHSNVLISRIYILLSDLFDQDLPAWLPFSYSLRASGTGFTVQGGGAANLVAGLKSRLSWAAGFLPERL